MAKQLMLGAKLTPKSTAIYAGLQITAQLAQVREATDQRLTTPREMVDLCKDMETMAQEAFVVITLNAKNMIISRHLITLGIADASLVHPREVYRPAIADGALAIVCIHNHPSGDPSPSAEDLKITRQLVDAGKILDIKLMDHVIIGRKNDRHEGFLSLAESGLVTF